MNKKEKAVQRAIPISMLYDRNRKDDSQLRFLYDLAELAPDGPAVECGVYTGGSLSCWSVARIGRGPVIAIDNWVSKNYERFLANMTAFNIKCETIHGNSWEATIQLDYKEFAFVFIDADHGENGIPHDIKIWPHLMMTGGILVFHDYDVWKPTVVVKREVDKWHSEAQWEKIGKVGSTIAFRK